jgi:hypothetical protein
MFKVGIIVCGAILGWNEWQESVRSKKRVQVLSAPENQLNLDGVPLCDVDEEHVDPLHRMTKSEFGVFAVGKGRLLCGSEDGERCAWLKRTSIFPRRRQRTWLKFLHQKSPFIEKQVAESMSSFDSELAFGGKRGVILISHWWPTILRKLLLETPFTTVEEDSIQPIRVDQDLKYFRKHMIMTSKSDAPWEMVVQTDLAELFQGMPCMDWFPPHTHGSTLHRHF